MVVVTDPQTGLEFYELSQSVAIFDPSGTIASNPAGIELEQGQRAGLSPVDHRVTRMPSTFFAFPWRWPDGEGCALRVVAVIDPNQTFRFETGR
jgi:kynurenine formamidase